MGFILLSIILSYFGILIINKSSLILFILTIFSRIVFFALTVAILCSIVTKKINSNLFSLNIITVLFIVSITYCNVFIFFPIVSSTICLGYNNFYTTVDNTYNNLYTSVNNIYTNIENNTINKRNHLNICIESCEIFFSPFYDFFKAGPKFAVETFLVFWH